MIKFALAILMSASAVSGTRLGCLEDVYQELFAGDDDFWLERDDIENEWWWTTDMSEMYDLGQDDWFLADFEGDDQIGQGEADDWGNLSFDHPENGSDDDIGEDNDGDRDDSDDWATLGSSQNFTDLRNQVNANSDLTFSETEFEIDNGEDWANHDSNDKKNFKNLRDPVNVNDHLSFDDADFVTADDEDWDFGL